MDKFTASNGITVAADEGVTFGGEYGFTYYGVSSKQFQALREFFQAERDEELGRWRWSENPDYVVYPPAEDDEDQAILILFEPGGGSNRYTREWLAGVKNPDGWAIARCATSYFEAHPERKPWEDAKHEEVWLLTVNGDTGPFLADQDSDSPVAAFVAANGTRIARYDREQITAGRRIYPEASDVD